MANALEDLSPAKRRRLIARALLRAVATSALLVAGYYVLPFDKTSDAASLVVLTVGMIAVIAIVFWQVRSIIGSDYPAIRAIEALTASAPLLLLTFAASYYLMERASAANFSQHLSRTDALYFTVTTFSTVGFGDITPNTEIARLAVTVQMIVDLLLLGVGVRVFVGAVRIGQQRRTGGNDNTTV